MGYGSSTYFNEEVYFPEISDIDTVAEIMLSKQNILILQGNY